MSKYTRPREIEIPREIDYEKYYKTIEKYYSGRDYSHGWDHVTKVCENALLLCKNENICCEREIIIIIIDNTIVIQIIDTDITNGFSEAISQSVFELFTFYCAQNLLRNKSSLLHRNRCNHW